jgi:toxin-antitoxin system PIN domain toxin
VIVPDVNVLLYAHVDGFDQHDAAREWWGAALSGRETIGLAPVVISGFVRLVTSSRVLVSPMTTSAAVSVVESWLDHPMTDVLVSDERHLRATLALLVRAGAAGNLTTDALIAAHALQRSASVASNDTDFGRFEGLVVDNPVATRG